MGAFVVESDDSWMDFGGLIYLCQKPVFHFFNYILSFFSTEFLTRIPCQDPEYHVETGPFTRGVASCMPFLGPFPHTMWQNFSHSVVKYNKPEIKIE